MQVSSARTSAMRKPKAPEANRVRILAAAVAAKSVPLDFYDFLAVSFGTLTTAGFSNVVPATQHAQSLIILEQINGVLYVAVLIARLTGIYQPSPPQS